VAFAVSLMTVMPIDGMVILMSVMSTASM
jgi:hypothetical protein